MYYWIFNILAYFYKTQYSVSFNTKKGLIMARPMLKERSFLTTMKVYTAHLCKDAKASSLKDSARYLKGKKFSCVQVDNDVVVTRIK